MFIYIITVLFIIVLVILWSKRNIFEHMTQPKLEFMNAARENATEYLKNCSNKKLHNHARFLSSTLKPIFGNEDCAQTATKICKTTDPQLYLTESHTFPPKWIGPYKDAPYPHSTSLKCWQEVYSCCKSST